MSSVLAGTIPRADKHSTLWRPTVVHSLRLPVMSPLHSPLLLFRTSSTSRSTCTCPKSRWRLARYATTRSPLRHTTDSLSALQYQIPRRKTEKRDIMRSSVSSGDLHQRKIKGEHRDLMSWHRMCSPSRREGQLAWSLPWVQQC